MRPVLFMLVGLTAACNSDPGAVTGLTLSPPAVMLEVTDGMEVRQPFTVTASYEDGTSVDVTAQVELTFDPAFGQLDHAAVVTHGSTAGITVLTAKLDDQVTTAAVTIRVHGHRVGSGAPANAATLFGDGVTSDPARAPTIVYPPDAVTVPKNLGELDVHWHDVTTADVFEIELDSEFADLHVYVGGNPSWMTFLPAEWQTAAGGSPAVRVTVRGAAASAPGVIGTSGTQTVTLTERGLNGGLYYFAGSSTDVSFPEGIYRHDVASPSQPPERFYTTNELVSPDYPSGRCVACHALSRDGTRMAIGYDGGGGAATILDVASRTVLPSPGSWTFAAFTPLGDRLVTTSDGVLSIRDPATGAVLDTVPSVARATHPGFSPTGDLFVATAIGDGPALDWSFSNGSIITQSYDASAHTFGTPHNLVPSDGVTQNNYYPAVSPDGAWIIFDRTNGGCYNDAAAQLWAVPSNGASVPFPLATANVGPGLTNSWARWAPFSDAVAGEPVMWLTFSSKRDFGVRMVGADRPQLWMVPFYPMRAAAGQDPTGPAFRLPFQDLSTGNHIAQWTEQIVPIL